jgi:hypothetical protein
MDVFVTSAEGEREALPGFVEVFLEGPGRAGDVQLTEPECQALRAKHHVGDEDFLLVVIDDNGDEVRTYDSPAKTGVILEALGRSSAESL